MNFSYSKDILLTLFLLNYRVKYGFWYKQKKIPIVGTYRYTSPIIIVAYFETVFRRREFAAHRIRGAPCIQLYDRGAHSTRCFTSTTTCSDVDGKLTD